MSLIEYGGGLRRTMMSARRGGRSPQVGRFTDVPVVESDDEQPRRARPSHSSCGQAIICIARPMIITTGGAPGHRTSHTPARYRSRPPGPAAGSDVIHGPGYSLNGLYSCPASVSTAATTSSTMAQSRTDCSQPPERRWLRGPAIRRCRVGRSPRLGTGDVTGFVRVRIRGRSPGWARLLATALRSRGPRAAPAASAATPRSGRCDWRGRETGPRSGRSR